MLPAISITAWFIVRSKPQREKYALQNLELRTLEAFLPRVVEREYGPGDLVVQRPVPLFPGYLFVRMQFPAEYYQVIWTPGVRDLVSLGSGPIPLGDEVIAGIRSRCDARGVVHLPDAPWSPGDQLEIPSGPFAGLLATVVTVMPRRRRIKLLIDFLAQQTPIEIPLAILKPSRTVGPRPAGRRPLLMA